MQPSLSSGLIFSTFTYPGPLLALLEDVHCTMTGGALRIQRTTDVRGYNHFPRGGDRGTWGSNTLLCFAQVHHTSEAFHGLVLMSAMPVLLSTCLNPIPLAKPIWNSPTSVKPPDQGLPSLSLQMWFLPLLCFPRALVYSDIETPDGFLTHSYPGSCFRRSSFSDTFA